MMSRKLSEEKMERAELAREVRVFAGLSQRAAGKVVHRTEKAWARWERGEIVFDDAMLELFCLKCGIRMDGDRLKRAKPVRMFP